MRSTFFLDFLIEIVDVDGLVWWRICLHHFARLLRTASRLLDSGFEEDGKMAATLLDYRQAAGVVAVVRRSRLLRLLSAGPASPRPLASHYFPYSHYTSLTYLSCIGGGDGY